MGAELVQGLLRELPKAAGRGHLQDGRRGPVRRRADGRGLVGQGVHGAHALQKLCGRGEVGDGGRRRWLRSVMTSQAKLVAASCLKVK